MTSKVNQYHTPYEMENSLGASGLHFNFRLYSPVKLMKRIFYVLGPLVVGCGAAAGAALAGAERLRALHRAADWRGLLQPDAWVAALAQALLAAQLAGGYLISAGDSIYSATNAQW